MAETCKCALLILALITCFHILFTEGRSIKTTNKQELVSIEKESLKEISKQIMNTNLHHNTANNQKVSLPTPPIHIPSVHHSKAGRKETSHSMVPSFSDSAGARHPKTPGANSNHGHSVTAFKDDFQPTTSGHSPGVGHTLADEDDSEDVDQKAPGTGSSIQRSSVAFKPTTPGHSPGIGHVSSVDQTDKTDPKASSIDHSVTEVPDDFRPTVSGHSPKVGHVFQTQTKNLKHRTWNLDVSNGWVYCTKE